MTDLWVRESASDAGPSLYRWRLCESGEQGVCTLSELAARWPEASLALLISGIDCPSRRVTFKPEEKIHLARLIPYEIEADLAQDVTSLHVALGVPVQGRKGQRKEADDGEKKPEVIVSYMDKRDLSDQIMALESAGFDVRHCYAEPLLLRATTTAWILRLVGEQVDISWGAGSAASVDVSMLGVFLDSLWQAPQAAGATAPQLLRLQALTSGELEVLGLQVSVSASMQVWQPEVQKERLASAWDGIEGCGMGATGAVDKVITAIPDLRQGAFTRPVRWRKYWRPMRLPLVAAGLAALTFAAVSLIETQLNNQRFHALQQEIESVYREVVPAGVLVDAEQQLRAQLGQLRGDFRGGSVLAMLDMITPQLSNNAQISISRLSYNGANTGAAQSELQLNIEAASNTDILQFSELLNSAGLQARAQNMTQAGNRQQASMIITEAVP